jgi:hypothetical protein
MPGYCSHDVFLFVSAGGSALNTKGPFGEYSCPFGEMGRWCKTPAPMCALLAAMEDVLGPPPREVSTITWNQSLSYAQLLTELMFPFFPLWSPFLPVAASNASHVENKLNCRAVNLYVLQLRSSSFFLSSENPSAN